MIPAASRAAQKYDPSSWGVADRTILVVEDEADLRETLAIALEHEQFEVRQSGNGRDALCLLESSIALPSVILLDLMMPVMNGATFMRELRARPRLAQIPVVVLSAAVQYIETPGATAAFRKPVSLEVLVRTLRALCAADDEAGPRSAVH